MCVRVCVCACVCVRAGMCGATSIAPLLCSSGRERETLVAFFWSFLTDILFVLVKREAFVVVCES